MHNAKCRNYVLHNNRAKNKYGVTIKDENIPDTFEAYDNVEAVEYIYYKQQTDSDRLKKIAESIADLFETGVWNPETAPYDDINKSPNTTQGLGGTDGYKIGDYVKVEDWGDEYCGFVYFISTRVEKDSEGTWKQIRYQVYDDNGKFHDKSYSSFRTPKNKPKSKFPFKLPKYNIGDKVTFNDEYNGGTKQGTITDVRSNKDGVMYWLNHNDWGIREDQIIPEKPAPEPAPKFKIGDYVEAGFDGKRFEGFINVLSSEAWWSNVLDERVFLKCEIIDNKKIQHSYQQCVNLVPKKTYSKFMYSIPKYNVGDVVDYTDYFGTKKRDGNIKTIKTNAEGVVYWIDNNSVGVPEKDIIPKASAAESAPKFKILNTVRYKGGEYFIRLVFKKDNNWEYQLENWEGKYTEYVSEKDLTLIDEEPFFTTLRRYPKANIGDTIAARHTKNGPIRKGKVVGISCGFIVKKQVKQFIFWIEGDGHGFNENQVIDLGNGESSTPTPTPESAPKFSPDKKYKNSEIVELAKWLEGNPQLVNNYRPILESYSGNGGNAKSSDRGILDEYYTPDYICEYIYKLAVHHGYSKGRILEPSAAVGRMIKPFIANKDYREIAAFELNDDSRRILKLLYPEIKIEGTFFERAFLEPPKYNTVAKKSWLGEFDLIVGNPPYGPYNNYYSEYWPKKERFEQIEAFFIYKCMQLLRKGGLLIFVIPSGFLNTGDKYLKAKERIGELAELVDAYRLPAVFQKTDICTDIVVMKRK